MTKSKSNVALIGSLALGLALSILFFSVGDAPARAVSPGGQAGERRVCSSGCPYSSLQAAVDAADPGDRIKVAAGHYTDVHARAGISQVVYISKSLTIAGGYTTTNWTQADPIAWPTILDAGGQGRAIYAMGNPAIGARQTLSLTIEGLHLTGGDAAGLGGWQWGNAGGGLYVSEAKATIGNCRLYGNTAGGGADDIGGGLYVYNSIATLRGNRVVSNTAGGGAGLLLHFSVAALESNVVAANAATYNGGGLFLYFAGGSTLESNVIDGNSADLGGGLFLFDSDVSLTNNVVKDNQGRGGSCGLHIRRSAPRLLHTTIVNNGNGDGIGVYVDDWNGAFSTVALSNTILVSHSVGISVTTGNTATLAATLWQANGTNHSGNVGHSADYGGDPAFAADGYHLGEGSAAIDRGVDTGVRIDVDGQRRPQGQGFDLGADEVKVVYIVYLPLVIRGQE